MMLSYTYALQVLLVTAHVVMRCDAVNTDLNDDATLFRSERIKDIMTSTKYKLLQNEQNVKVETVNEAAAIEALKGLSKNFTDVLGVLQDLRTQMQTLLFSPDASDSANLTECCNTNVDELAFNPYFNTKISTKALCTRVAGTNNPFVVSTETMKTVIEELKKIQFKNDMIKWQYVGTEEGVLFSFPQDKGDQCRNYDPRVRPWYIDVASRKPKDVIIVVDKSKGMNVSVNGQTKLDLAKKAINFVLDTLSPKDRVAIVAFSDSTKILKGPTDSSCFAQQFAPATPDVKNAFREFLQKSVMTDDANSIYLGHDNGVGVLRVAYDYFKGSSENNSKVLLFLSGVEPADSAEIIENYIETKHEELKNVWLLTYGIRQDLDILKNMADKAKIYSGNETQTGGQYKQVMDNTDLRYAMGSYYQLFSDSSEPTVDSPTISAPYIDVSALGTIMAACLPLYINTTNTTLFRGASCIDISVSDVSRLLDFSHTGRSYGFVVDSLGRTITHPLLPPPGHSEDFLAEPLIVNIVDLEHDCRHVVEEMLSRSVDNHKRCVTKRLSKPLGHPATHGAAVENVSATYYWQYIGESKTLLAVVVLIDDEQSVVANGAVESKSFLFHQLHLNRNIGRSCVHMGTEARNSSTVAFTSGAFDFPYLVGNPNKGTIDTMKSFFTDSATTNRAFKKNIRELVALTERFDDEWKLVEDGLHQYFVFMKPGILRLYPGVSVGEENYPDLSNQLWLQAAMAQPDKLILSGAEPGLSGRYPAVVTAAKAFRFQLSSERWTQGVAGFHVILPSFQKELFESLGSCSKGTYRCMVIDEAGFLILHPNFLKDPPSNLVHVSEIETQLTQVLMDRGHVERHVCNDYAWKQSYNNWKLHVEDNFYLQDNELEYFLSRSDEDSNVMLAIVSIGVAHKSITREFTAQACPPTNQPPCYQDLEYNPCTRQFESLSNTRLCSRSSANISFQAHVRPAIYGKPCLSIDCGAIHYMADCELYNATCRWCLNKCINTVCTVEPTDPSPGHAESSTNAAAVIVPVILILAVLVLVAVILCWCRDRLPCRKPKYTEDGRDPEYYDSIPPQSSRDESMDQRSKSSKDSRATGFMNAAYAIDDPIVSCVAVPAPPPKRESSTDYKSSSLGSAQPVAYKTMQGTMQAASPAVLHKHLPQDMYLRSPEGGFMALSSAPPSHASGSPPTSVLLLSPGQQGDAHAAPSVMYLVPVNMADSQLNYAQMPTPPRSPENSDESEQASEGGDSYHVNQLPRTRPPPPASLPLESSYLTQLRPISCGVPPPLPVTEEPPEDVTPEGAATEPGAEPQCTQQERTAQEHDEDVSYLAHKMKSTYLTVMEPASPVDSGNDTDTNLPHVHMDPTLDTDINSPTADALTPNTQATGDTVKYSVEGIPDKEIML